MTEVWVRFVRACSGVGDRRPFLPRAPRGHALYAEVTFTDCTQDRWATARDRLRTRRASACRAPAAGMSGCHSGCGSRRMEGLEATVRPPLVPFDGDFPSRARLARTSSGQRAPRGTGTSADTSRDGRMDHDDARPVRVRSSTVCPRASFVAVGRAARTTRPRPSRPVHADDLMEQRFSALQPEKEADRDARALPFYTAGQTREAVILDGSFQSVVASPSASSRRSSHPPMVWCGRPHGRMRLPLRRTPVGAQSNGPARSRRGVPSGSAAACRCPVQACRGGRTRP